MLVKHDTRSCLSVHLSITQLALPFKYSLLAFSCDTAIRTRPLTASMVGNRNVEAQSDDDWDPRVHVDRVRKGREVIVGVPGEVWPKVVGFRA